MQSLKVPCAVSRRVSNMLTSLTTIWKHRHRRDAATVLTSMRTAGRRLERHAYAAAVAVVLQVTLIPSSMAAPAVHDGRTVMYWSSAQMRGE